MAKKSLGHVELQWTCPNCSTRNPGPQKTCPNCGAPQPDNVEFEQAAQETIITDEEKIAQAKAGPDIHCYYCGTRNPANAPTCSQCGADLSEGAKRKSGQVLGAHRDRPAKQIECPACGTANEADAPNCVNCGASLVEPQPKPEPQVATKPIQQKKGGFGRIAVIVGVVVLACAALITLFVLFNRTEDVIGTARSVSWSRSIEIEGLVPVTYEDWHDEIPADGVMGSCTSKARYTQDERPANAQSREICGTPYTVDSGSGFGEVVQDCQYEVFENFCEYTVEEWQKVDEKSLSGEDLSPRWPTLALSSDEREADRTETYRCIFSTEDGQYSYSSSDQNLLTQCEIGSRWILKINTFDMVTDIEPAN